MALNAFLLVCLRGEPPFHAGVRIIRIVPLDSHRLDCLGILLALVGKFVDARDLLGEDLALVQRVFWGGCEGGDKKMGFRMCARRRRRGEIMATNICET